MHRFLAEVILLVIIVTSCSHEKNRVEKAHLHNFPYLDGCPSLEEKAIDNEKLLKAQAKMLNIRYVDYLHLLTTKGIMPRNPLETKNIDLTITE
jgi:hypothetical protein